MLYWIFLIIWSFFAAYVVVVQQVQNTLAERLDVLLFGDEKHAGGTTAHGVHHDAHAGHGAHTAQESHGSHAMHEAAEEIHIFRDDTLLDITDEFIVEQLKRTK